MISNHAETNNPLSKLEITQSFAGCEMKGPATERLWFRTLHGAVCVCDRLTTTAQAQVLVPQ